MSKLICRFIFFTFILINHCTIENKKPAERKELPNPFSCGTYVSKVYPREHRIERYPDLGMVLLEDKLELTPNQIKSLRKAAASCTLRCQVRKEEISRLTQELHLSLTRKEYLSGNLSRLAYQLNKIDNQKEKWLALHQARYTDGLRLLDKKQKSMWEKVVKKRIGALP